MFSYPIFASDLVNPAIKDAMGSVIFDICVHLTRVEIKLIIIKSYWGLAFTLKCVMCVCACGVCVHA